MHFIKNPNIDVDVFDGDLILMHLDTRQVVVLNKAAHVLWLAIDTMRTKTDLLDLLREARPDIEVSQLERSLNEILEPLLNGDFLRAQAA